MTQRRSPKRRTYKGTDTRLYGTVEYGTNIVTSEQQQFLDMFHNVSPDEIETLKTFFAIYATTSGYSILGDIKERHGKPSPGQLYGFIVRVLRVHRVLR